MRLSPRTLDLFLTSPAEMPRRRPGRTAAGTALAAFAAFSLLGAESADAGSGKTPPTHTSSAYRTTSETSCASGDLWAELTAAQHGAGQTHAELVLVNMTGRSCTVAGHPAVFRVDAAGRRLGAPAAADGPDGSPVLLAAGGRAVAGLTLSAAGLFPGCEDGDGGPAADVAGLQVIPPGGRTALPVAGAPETGPDRGCAEPEPNMMRVTALATAEPDRRCRRSRAASPGSPPPR